MWLAPRRRAAYCESMGLFRKLLRRGFYAAAALSTLLLLATLILWPVSYYRWMSADYGTVEKTLFTQYRLFIAGGRACVAAHQGEQAVLTGVHFAGGTKYAPMADHWSYLSWNTPDPGDSWWTNSLGFGWEQWGFAASLSSLILWSFSLAIPFSYLALLFAILPLLAFRAIRRRRRVARVGLCGKCGYDLRAHAIGEKCPECGTVIAKKP